LESGKDLDLNLAYKAVEDAAKLKVFNINLSGGETLVYPHLNELLAKIKEKKLHSAIAVSGWNLNREKLEELIFAGVNYIFISLNGSKESVNKLSRDGYEYALSAMRLLASETRIKKGINWVARNDNIDDFPKLVELAEKYGFNSIVILENKPDLNGNVISLPEEEKLKQLAKFVREYSLENSDMAIIVEECYSPLRALLGKTWIGNRNRGDFRGCTAGRTTAALDVDGNWMPCRHIFKAEFYGSLEEYWSDSKVLEELRNHEDNRDINCLECDLKDACLPCRAAGDKYLCSLKKPM
jgi:pyrroloquinoline quinone biosynthesis protein E